MPSRQRRAVFDDVTRRPKDSPLVEPPRHVVVGTQDIKVSGVDSLDHEVDGLLGRPGRGRLFAAAPGGEPREYETVNQKVRAYSAAGRVSQLVLQRFGESFHARLRNIVGGIAGRGGNALFRAGVDDEARPSALDHARRENLRPVNHAPKVDAENTAPVLQGSEDLA